MTGYLTEKQLRETERYLRRDICPSLALAVGVELSDKALRQAGAGFDGRHLILRPALPIAATIQSVGTACPRSIASHLKLEI